MNESWRYTRALSISAEARSLIGRRGIQRALSGALVACATKQPEPVAVVPITLSVPQGSQLPDTIVLQVNADDPQYVEMGVAGVGWARRLVSGKTIGIHQPDNAPEPIMQMVAAATQRYSYRPIRPQDVTVDCAPNSTVAGGAETCTLRPVAAIIQLNSIWVQGGVGYVGAAITSIPRGKRSTETVYHCIAIVKQASGWEAIRAFGVTGPRRCPK